MSKNFTNSINQRSNTEEQSLIKIKSSTKMNMSMGFKKLKNKILVHLKSFDITIDHILVHFVGSKQGLYVSFRIPLYNSPNLDYRNLDAFYLSTLLTIADMVRETLIGSPLCDGLNVGLLSRM